MLWRGKASVVGGSAVVTKPMQLTVPRSVCNGADNPNLGGCDLSVKGRQLAVKGTALLSDGSHIESRVEYKMQWYKNVVTWGPVYGINVTSLEYNNTYSSSSEHSASWSSSLIVKRRGGAKAVLLSDVRMDYSWKNSGEALTNGTTPFFVIFPLHDGRQVMIMIMIMFPQSALTITLPNKASTTPSTFLTRPVPPLHPP